MGNYNSKDSQQSNTIIKEIQDIRYGGLIRISQEKNRLIANKALQVKSKQEQNALISLIMKRSKLMHRNFITVRNYKSYLRNELCSRFSALYVCFQYVENDLEKQILKRSEIKDYFPENYLCEILTQIVDCLKFLEDRRCFHGDIKPSNIFLDTNNRVKILDSHFTNLGKTNFEIVLSNPSNLSYLSPSQLSNLRKGHYNDLDQNQYKNQIFSLGMTMIELMLLGSSYQCYELTLLRILQNKIQQKIVEMRARYSQEFVDLVSSFLEIEQLKRPDYSKILNSNVLLKYTTKLSVSSLESQSRLGPRESVIIKQSRSQFLSYHKY